MNGNKAVAIIDMSTSCLECPFLGEIVEQPMGGGVYRKIARCCFLEDDYEDVAWLLSNKFDGCPLRPLPEELGTEAFSGRDGCYFGDREEE